MLHFMFEPEKILPYLVTKVGPAVAHVILRERIAGESEQQH